MNIYDSFYNDIFKYHKDLNNISENIKNKIINEIIKLRKVIHYHNKKYFIDNEPEVSDSEYDNLLKILIKLEEQYPNLYNKNSPSQKIGSDLLNTFPIIKHKTQIKGLTNNYSYKELENFKVRIEKEIKTSIIYVAEPKIDGISIILRYINGELEKAITRGDGYKGNDVTNNIKTIGSIPLILKDPIDIEVRGEIFFPINQFEKLNQTFILKSEKPFANPRNAASGSIKLLNSKECAKRPLDSFIYEIIDQNSDKWPNSHFERLKILKKLGFKTNPNNANFNNLNKLIKHIKKFEKQKNKLNYDVDGLVIKIDSISQQKYLGSTAKEPKWAIAYKFPSKQITTKILDIKLSIGRFGTITPIAHLEPVFLSGTTISKASLHNFSQLQQKDIRISDTVFLEKGGEIIPKIISVITSKRKKNSKIFQIPEKCPSCTHILKKNYTEWLLCSNLKCKNQTSRWNPTPKNKTFIKFCPLCKSKTKKSKFITLKCQNIKCKEKIKQKLIHFCSKSALNIKEIGKKTIELLINNNFLQKITDLYELESRKKELIELKGFKKKSVDNLLKSIRESKNSHLEKLIYALGIEHIGSEASKKLAQNFSSLEELTNSNFDELQQKSKLGDISIKNLKFFLSQKENKNLFFKLNKFGINTKNFENNLKKIKKNEFFSGKSFVFTGKFNTFTRSQLNEKVTLLGGKLNSSLSKKTDYLVVGKNPGSKKIKAQKLNISILTEKDFLKKVS